MFGRAAITLGIGAHDILVCISNTVLHCDLLCIIVESTCIRQLQEPLRQDNLESALGSGSWSVHSGSVPRMLDHE